MHAPLHVVVVDDHAIYRQGIVRALLDAGEVVDADEGNGTIALDRIRRLPPDVALVDVRMPGSTGSTSSTHSRAMAPTFPSCCSRRSATSRSSARDSRPAPPRT